LTVLKSTGRLIGYAHGRPQGGKRAFPSLEIGTKKQKFRENLKLAAKFLLIHLIVAMTLVGLYCMTIKKAKIFKRALQVTVVGFFRK